METAETKYFEYMKKVLDILKAASYNNKADRNKEMDDWRSW